MNRSSKWLQAPAAVPDNHVRRTAEERQKNLTKPPGSLGMLEEVAIQLASLQATKQPNVNRVFISVFAADHGVAEEGISAFPQAVTVEMLKNFSRGGAAISVLANELRAQLEVINLGTVTDPGPLQGVKSLQLAPGTANFCREAAMSEKQLTDAMHAGQAAVERAMQADTQLFIGGEMGIGNTTSATALACAMLDAPASLLTGPGTGLDISGVAHKIAIINKALDLHSQYLSAPSAALRRLGGFEIAALTGSYIACSQLGLPVLVDGFISTVAALAATKIYPGTENWLLYSHQSAEPGHRVVLEALSAKPLLDIGMRLGEGSGAAVALPLLRMACALHNGMATFAEAEISSKL